MYDFMKKVLENVEKELTISKVEKNRFHFTGLNVAAVRDGIEVLMDDYVQSLKGINEIRKADMDEELIRVDMK